jgi:selenocysteine lyase/cysteine desulfurase
MTTDRRTFLGTLGVLGVACTRPIVARPPVPRGRLVAPDDFAFAPSAAYTPYTHSSGVCSIPSVHGLGAAIAYMTAIGIERVLAYNLELHRHAYERLSALPKLRIVSAKDGPVASPLLTYVLPAGIDSGELGGRLIKNHHVEVKTVPANWLNGHRVSTHVFNSTDDVDRLASALEVELRRSEARSSQGSRAMARLRGVLDSCAAAFARTTAVHPTTRAPATSS